MPVWRCHVGLYKGIIGSHGHERILVNALIVSSGAGVNATTWDQGLPIFWVRAADSRLLRPLRAFCHRQRRYSAISLVGVVDAVPADGAAVAASRSRLGTNWPRFGG